MFKTQVFFDNFQLKINWTVETDCNDNFIISMIMKSE